ncbi:mitochondrial transcription rescue factor 1 isoform X1 [Colletes latitarsis]|uniref:mitochondrial transcription rescue factor 1 isoform X1 n=1 Tax=Colletes latitarsis TaxID=2605962 RepID=UPI0040353E30
MAYNFESRQPRIIYNFMRRTICENKRISHILKDSSKFYSQRYNLFVNYSYLERNLNLVIFKRFKSKKQTSEHVDDNEDEDELPEIDDYLQTKNSKIVRATVTSLRLDAIAKVGFGLSRTKIEEAFYNSNIRVNGEKYLKKSALVKVEDEIDLVIGRSSNSSNFLIVHRCVILLFKATSDGIIVKLLRNKSLLIEDYADPWNGVPN